MFFDKGLIERLECLLKNEIISFPAALLSLFLVTSIIKSL